MTVTLWLIGIGDALVIVAVFLAGLLVGMTLRRRPSGETIRLDSPGARRVAGEW